MIHQPYGGMEGVASDIDIHARRLLKTKSQMINLLSLHTGQKEEKIKNDIERDYYMTPEDALEYNLIDEIILKEKQA